MCDQQRKADIRSGTFPQCTTLVATRILCNALNAPPFINVSATIWQPGGRLAIVARREINRSFHRPTDEPSVTPSAGRASSWSPPVIVASTPAKAWLVSAGPRSKQSVRTFIDPIAARCRPIRRINLSIIVQTSRTGRCQISSCRRYTWPRIAPLPSRMTAPQLLHNATLKSPHFYFRCYDMTLGALLVDSNHLFFQRWITELISARPTWTWRRAGL